MEDFFEPGTTYVAKKPYTAPELLGVFKCEAVRDSPNLDDQNFSGRWAFGWATFAYPGTDWKPSAFPMAAWEAGWVPAAHTGTSWEPASGKWEDTV